jgi:hypothetical protein
MKNRAFWFLLVWLASPLPATFAASGGETPQLFMPDGQLKSHTIRVYVTHDISVDQKPTLRLLRSHAVTKKAVDESLPLKPSIVAPGQEWVEQVGGQDIRRKGTLLLFDLSDLDSDYKAMLRVMPVVSWIEDGSEHLVISPSDVNLGNIVAVIGWTFTVVGIAVLLIVLLSWRKKGNPLQLLTGVDGHLSLSQTQVACWTVFIGGVVLGYGMLKFEVPDIPTSLLALMGASLVTGGVSYFQDAKKQQTTSGAATQYSPDFADLIRTFTPGQSPELSLAKAQMLFWTLLLLVIFVSKSILDGVIWDVPWPLVALMGFSQAGYLAPKLTPGPSASNVNIG